MTTGQNPEGIELSEEEASALLALCLTSPHPLDVISERALRKLAKYCISQSNHKAKYQLDRLVQQQASA